MSASPDAEEQRHHAPTVSLRKDFYIRLRDEVVKLRARNNEIKAELADADKENVDLKVKLETSENTTISLQKELQENDVVIEKFKTSNGELEKELAEDNAIILDLKEAKEELEKNATANILVIENMKRELEDQRLKYENSELSLKKVEELQGLVNFLKEEGEVLEKKLEHKNESIKQLNDKYSEAEHINKEFEMRITLLQEEISEKRNEIEKKQDANEKLLCKNKDLKEKLEFVKISMQKGLGKLKRKNEELEKKNNDLEGALERGTQINLEKIEELKMLQKEREEAQILKRKFDEVKLSLLDQEKQVQTLKEVMDNLKVKYKEAKEHNQKILKEASFKINVDKVNEDIDIENELLLIDEEWCAIHEARQEAPDVGISKESIQNLFSEEKCHDKSEEVRKLLPTYTMVTVVSPPAKESAKEKTSASSVISFTESMKNRQKSNKPPVHSYEEDIKKTSLKAQVAESYLPKTSEVKEDVVRGKRKRIDEEVEVNLKQCFRAIGDPSNNENPKRKRGRPKKVREGTNIQKTKCLTPRKEETQVKAEFNFIPATSISLSDFKAEHQDDETLEESTESSKSVSRLLEEMDKFSSFCQSSQKDESPIYSEGIETKSSISMEELLRKTDELLGENNSGEIEDVSDDVDDLLQSVNEISEDEKGEDVSDDVDDLLKSDNEISEEEDIDDVSYSEENSTEHPLVNSEVAKDITESVSVIGKDRYKTQLWSCVNQLFERVLIKLKQNLEDDHHSYEYSESLAVKFFKKFSDDFGLEMLENGEEKNLLDNSKKRQVLVYIFLYYEVRSIVHCTLKKADVDEESSNFKTLQERFTDEFVQQIWDTNQDMNYPLDNAKVTEDYQEQIRSHILCRLEK